MGATAGADRALLARVTPPSQPRRVTTRRCNLPRRRQGPRPVPRRLGHREGAPGRPRRRHVPDVGGDVSSVRALRPSLREPVLLDRVLLPCARRELAPSAAPSSRNSSAGRPAAGSPASSTESSRLSSRDVQPGLDVIDPFEQIVQGAGYDARCRYPLRDGGDTQVSRRAPSPRLALHRRSYATMRRAAAAIRSTLGSAARSRTGSKGIVPSTATRA
jgi:hypothetical protein